MNDKFIFGSVAIVCATGLQCAAWFFGYNGQVFALTSLVIGGVTGTLLGFKISKGVSK